jgi:hypothetical protein
MNSEGPKRKYTYPSCNSSLKMLSSTSNSLNSSVPNPSAYTTVVLPFTSSSSNSAIAFHRSLPLDSTQFYRLGHFPPATKWQPRIDFPLKPTSFCTSFHLPNEKIGTECKIIFERNCRGLDSIEWIVQESFLSNSASTRQATACPRNAT